MENRKKLIREVLDSDQHINALVTNITHNKIMGMDEEATPYVQINQEEIDRMSAAATALRQILEKKVFVGHQLENAKTRTSLYRRRGSSSWLTWKSCWRPTPVSSLCTSAPEIRRKHGHP